jgi:hypothetical protein
LIFILAADKSHIISSSISRSSTPCSPEVPNICSKGHSSDYLLLATYFDIGIIRTLFSPSWLTDGYLWCLEYLHKRISDISDEILSNNHISSHHLKSFSISQLNNLPDQIYSPHLILNTSVNHCLNKKNSDYFLRQKREKK